MYVCNYKIHNTRFFYCHTIKELVVIEFSTAQQSTINNTLNNKVQDRTRKHMQEMYTYCPLY